MTEAWKSVPKKFCEVCKCWFYDNKVSVQHHEQGNRHKANVQKKLRELGKKGREQAKEGRERRMILAKMETEATRSYKKDLKKQQQQQNLSSRDMNFSLAGELGMQNNLLSCVNLNHCNVCDVVVSFIYASL
ncbi:unnamed protein product [Soboliphyme baturini]|uniref:Matrin-type domain-containing protein n=1 Tax=Soboliphyme baturini TaxID=241478 RepID=A0A183IMC0_9BILA|nr:unnamed protein product [Soboliphyme baturini]